MKNALLVAIATVIIAAGVYFWAFNDEESAIGTPTPSATATTSVSVSPSVSPLPSASPTKTPTPAASDIRVTSPTRNAVITSPLIVRGEARGTWYFEASFPITLLDANGKVIARSHVQAQGDWMTENFVPFEGKIEFTKPTTATGTLLLEKDNPSGLPQYDKSISIPVRF